MGLLPAQVWRDAGLIAGLGTRLRAPRSSSPYSYKGLQEQMALALSAVGQGFSAACLEAQPWQALSKIWKTTVVKVLQG